MVLGLEEEKNGTKDRESRMEEWNGGVGETRMGEWEGDGEYSDEDEELTMMKTNRKNKKKKKQTNN